MSLFTKQSLLNKFLDIIFPRYCLGCKQSGTDLCTGCLQRFPSAKIHTLPKNLTVTARFHYHDPLVKDTIWALKYKKNRGLASILARALYDEIAEDLSDRATFDNFTNPLIIPIPLSRKRLRDRSFNQSELIAHELATLTNLPLETTVLTKIKDTPPQASLTNKTERLRNLTDCFSIKNPAVIKKRNIILIDDVTTTGATLKEAHKTLKSAGAGKIISYTVAH